MNVDERIERLAERYEAFARSLDLMQRQWEDRWAKITAALEQDAENIRGLAHIAEIHERRLTHLEGGE
jgi:hypothetical protein